jgi:hypothetical protein
MPRAKDGEEVTTEDKTIAAFCFACLLCCFVVLMSAMSCERQHQANDQRLDCVKAGKPLDECARVIQP